MAPGSTTESASVPSAIWRRAGRGFWARPHGERTAFDSGLAHGGKAQISGVVFGADWTVARRWLVGVGGGYSSGELTLDGLNESSDYNAPRAFGYVGYTRDRWIASFGASLARSAYETRRAFAFAAQLPQAFGSARIFGGVDRAALSTQAGLTPELWGDWILPLHLGSWAVRPGTIVRYARYGRDAWVEREALSLSLTGPDQTIASVQGEIGLGATRMTGRLRPYATTTYRRELGSGRTVTTLRLGDGSDGVFQIAGPALARNTFQARTGLLFRTDRYDRSLAFAFRRGSGETRRGVDLGFGF
jgi:uncharacterized protein with beta-barrel porin domain